MYIYTHINVMKINQYVNKKKADFKSLYPEES